MKLKFDPSLTYQHEAVSAVTDLFLGQATGQVSFSVPHYSDGEEPCPCANRLALGQEQLLANLQAVQFRGGLSQDSVLSKEDLNFDVEMETGTGKTYVYLRTIYELNRKYGFSKFIIVVPGIAVKESVHKFFTMTRAHFKGLYNITAESFVYDSGKLEQVRSYAAGDGIQIMIINIDAFRKSFHDPEKESKANLIHRANEKLNGRKPMELIRGTRPIVIIDEPQSVDHTLKAKEAIRSLAPLCILRYSATHREKHHLVYQLSAAQAFELGLVKQIEVAGFRAAFSDSVFLKLLGTEHTKTSIVAQVEAEVRRKQQVMRKVLSVKPGDCLGDRCLTNLSRYSGYVVETICCKPGEESVTFFNREEILTCGQSVGGADLQRKRLQIRRTVQEHLEKELRLHSIGVKVLSLFFIDRVSNYRDYDSAGYPQKGIYAIIFEEEYEKLIQNPKFRPLLNLEGISPIAPEVHNGYFAQDRKGCLKDTAGNTAEDEDVYGLIMREKERLLSFDTKLRFIFSHSALREGWDSPNVFQICTLNETCSNIKKRQEIGRGMRLCVNQNGDRVRGNDINVLTVMANESYEEFAAALQNEIAADELPTSGFFVKNAGDRLFVPQMPKGKGTEEKPGSSGIESVYFDTEQFVQNCIKEFQAKLSANLGGILYQKGRLDLSDWKIRTENTEVLQKESFAQTLPDILSFLQEKTNLTRRTIVRVLVGSNTLHLFQNNPFAYMDAAANLMADCMSRSLFTV